MTNILPDQPTTHCPPWCTQHDVLGVTDDDGRPVERHWQWLFAQWAPAVPDLPSVALYISESSSLSDGPGMGLQRFDGPPASIEPGEARNLAAALLKGAEIVEAARTATCPECQRPIAPAELDNRQECYQCEGNRGVTERRARRASMNVVRTEAP